MTIRNAYLVIVQHSKFINVEKVILEYNLPNDASELDKKNCFKYEERCENNLLS